MFYFFLTLVGIIFFFIKICGYQIEDSENARNREEHAKIWDSDVVMGLINNFVAVMQNELYRKKFLYSIESDLKYIYGDSYIYLTEKSQFPSNLSDVIRKSHLPCNIWTFVIRIYVSSKGYVTTNYELEKSSCC